MATTDDSTGASLYKGTSSYTGYTEAPAYTGYTEASSYTGYTVKASGDAASTPGASAPAVGAAIQSNNSTTATSVDNYIANYSGKGGRLTQFIHNDGTDDGARLAYIRLVSYTNMTEISASDKANKAKLDAIFTLLTTGTYDRFILNNFSENRAERISTMKTVGDSFSLTFSGREPLVVTINGTLIFDYDRNSQRMSWYLAFCNAYENYLRASVTARYNAKVRLVLPDFTVYEGYIISLNSQQDSQNDMMVPFSFSMVVTSEAFNQSYMSDTAPNTTAKLATSYTAGATPASDAEAAAAAPATAEAAADTSKEADKTASAEAAAAGSVNPATDGAAAKAAADKKVADKAAAPATKAAETKTTATTTAVVKKESLSEQIKKASAAINSAYNVTSSVATALGVRTSKNSIFK